jgi:hypothetical protein
MRSGSSIVVAWGADSGLINGPIDAMAIGSLHENEGFVSRKAENVLNDEVSQKKAVKTRLDQNCASSSLAQGKVRSESNNELKATELEATKETTKIARTRKPRARSMLAPARTCQPGQAEVAESLQR